MQRWKAGFLSDCNNQVRGGVEVEAFPGWDHRSGAVFGNDGGAGVLPAGLECFAGVDLRGKSLAVEKYCASWRGNQAELCSAWTAGGGRPHMVHFSDMSVFQHRRLYDGAETECYQLNFTSGMGVAVAALVFILEVR